MDFKNFTPYGSLIEHHLRIGDTEFYVPPTSISVQKQMKNQRTPILRARNSLPKESGYFDQVVELTLFFPNMDAINTELRPLLAQVKKCPFLPIENTRLNDVYKIDAVTISGITVQTTPGFPHTLQAVLQLYAFEPYSYITDDEGRTFDEMFNWPLFRWYYQRNLDPQTGSNFATYYEPLYDDLDNLFLFRIAAEDDLAAIKKWNNKKRNLIKEYVESKKDHFYGNEEREKIFNKEFDEMYEKAMFEYDIHYEDWAIPGLILTDFTVGFQNSIVSMQLQEDESPTHQYMGSQDTILVANFKAMDDEALASLETMVRRSTYLIREYHKEVANGYLEFDHQLARLFGVKNVTIEDMKSSTVEGQPGVSEVTLTMMAYNRAERKLNETKWMSETLDWSVDKYEDQGFWSLLTSLNPATWMPDWNDEDYEASDWLKSNPIYRWSKFIGDRPVAKEFMRSMKTFYEGQQQAASALTDKALQQYVYEEAAKNIFRASEVYPDLELPTYGEVLAAGFDIENSNDGIFVDPDFFIKYKKGTLFWENLLEAIQDNYQTVLRDGIGGEATMDAGVVGKTNSVTAKEIKDSQAEVDKSVENNQIKEEAVAAKLIDKGNISKDQMEALIREKAQKYKINQNLPLAFARTMDSELKQFYEKGTNAKQGKIVNSRTSSPVMMNKSFIFYTSKTGAVDGEYVGVMKVRRMYGSNANLLGKNIEYNIESGISKMADFYKELDRIYSQSAANGKQLYTEKNVYTLFGLQYKNGTFDVKKARFAGVLMMYLGYSNEYMALIKDNKKPPAKVVSIINSVLKGTTNKKEFTKQEIANKVKNLPVKDFKTAGATANAVPETMNTKNWDDNNKIHQGMFHDMIRYDMRGRLIRAFPTFFLTLIDEGQFVGSVKMSDQFFNYQAVMDIMYTNSRKDASSTLVLEMSNIYGTLDDAEKDMDLTNTSYREVFKAMTMPGAVAREAERSRHRNPNYYKSIMLRTGTRIHFRMGYGSNPMNMPTIMNGTITSIQNNGESVTVIAQDDGIELTNKIRADVNETTKGGWGQSKKEPTEIVDELLTDSQGFFKNLWAGLSNKEFQNHSLGIMHFGIQSEIQGVEQFKSSFGGVLTGALAGGAAGTALGPVGSAIGALGGAFTGGMFASATFGKEARPNSEVIMNVYQTTGLTNEEHDKWWNKVKDAFGVGASDESGININLYDKSVWDVLNICASVGDDHVVAVHPFGFRNTVFSGKTYFPLHYDYIVKDGEVAGTAVKPFRQFHAYDSVTSVIDNSIITTEENVRTVGVGVYLNEGEMETTDPVYVDTDIWPEKQRVVNIDTTTNAQGIRLIQNIPLVGSLLNKPLKWYFDEGVAIKMTARALSDYVRDMYDGYLTVMGDPSVKPYDQMWLNDTYNSMNGPADIKEVTQIMNPQTGYITLIKPDAVVVNSDKRSLGFTMSCLHIAGSALITMALRKKLSTGKYAGHLPIVNALWAMTKGSYDRMKERFKTSKVTSKLVDKLTGKAPKNLKAILKESENRKGLKATAKDLARWTKNGSMAQLQKLSGSGAGGQLKDILNNSKHYSVIKGLNLKSKASSLIAGGVRKSRPIARTAGNIAKGLLVGGSIAAGPIGWLGLAIEALAVQILSSTIGEFIERFLYKRQACLISPLMKNGLEFTAGINGHKGSVVGDAPDVWQKLLTNKFSSFLLTAVTGADTSQYSQSEREQGISVQTNNAVAVTAVKKAKAPTANLNTAANNLFNTYRKPVRQVPGLKELYASDRKAALQQIDKRKEILGTRQERAKYEEEKTSWAGWIKKIGDKITGWFTSLFDKVKDFFGSQGDDSVCIPECDVATGGKAKGLSKYFKVVGPKIEAECKKQGLSAYQEIIKAKCMQESGGNYARYPDVMQASESLGKPIGYIKDVDASIRQGVKYFGTIVKRCKGDIKMALQSYNFGSGFIDYCMKHGGKYTKDNAYNFALAQVKKHGKISRIPPGYGDSKYVDHVLRYYDGGLPNGECSNSETGAGGSSSCPSVTGSAGKKKYHLTSSEANKVLVNLKSAKVFGVTMVSGGGQAKARPGTVECLKNTASLYKAATGKTFNITSAWRPGDNNWHGTGWAADLDTPNTMRYISGKMRFPNGKDKNEARALAKAAIESGFRALWFGDWDIVQEMNKKYGAGTMTYDPSGHWNHLHVSYPICKKK